MDLNYEVMCVSQVNNFDLLDSCGITRITVCVSC